MSKYITTEKHFQWSKELQEYVYVSHKGYKYDGPLSLAGGLPARETGSWAFYDDGTESGSTIIGIERDNPTLDVDTIYQWRIVVEETAGNKWNNPSLQLQYRLNAGTWTDVNATSSVVQSAPSGNLTEGADTTGRIAGTGAFVAFAGVDDTNGLISDSTDPKSQYLNALYSITIVSGDVVDADTIELRLWDTVGADTLDVNQFSDPVITVNEGATQQEILPSFILSTTSLSEPVLALDSVLLSIDFISPTTALFEPSVLPDFVLIDLLFISSTTTLFEPVLLKQNHPFDDFSSNSNDLERWTTRNGSGFTITNEKLDCADTISAGYGIFVYSDESTGSPDHWAKVELSKIVSTDITAASGLIIRCDNAVSVDGYCLFVDDDFTIITTILNGAYDSDPFVDGTSINWAAGDELGVSVEGVDPNILIKVWQNPVGAAPDSWGVADLSHTIASGSRHDTGDFVGIAHWLANGQTEVWDNFSGGPVASTEIIVNVDFITNTTALFEPILNVGPVSLSIDFISTTTTLFEPSVSLLIVGQINVDFISSTSQTFTPDVGKKPIVDVYGITTPRFEGDVVNSGEMFMTWNGSTSLSDIGDLPPGLTFSTTSNIISHHSGTLSAGSAGNYGIQHRGTNSYGSTDSNIVPFKVQKKLSAGFISATSQTFLPIAKTVTSISDIGFIAATSQTFIPDVVAGTYTITDTGFIASTSQTFILTVEAVGGPQTISDVGFIAATSQTFIPTLTGSIDLQADFIASTSTTYKPSVIDAAFAQNYEIVEFVVKVSRQHSDEHKVTKEHSGSYKITKELS